MQSVTTPSGAGVVERFSEVFPTKKPLETASRRALPVFVMRKSKSLQTSRDGSIGFHRLLIEARAFAAALPKTVGADRREMSGLRSLRIYQPAERLQTCLKYIATRSPMTTQDHRMRKLCVVVGSDRLEPLPFLRTVSLKQLEQSRGEQVTQLIHYPVAGEAAQVFLHCEQDEGPGPRRSELLYDRQTPLE
jgi:hypothetical protein